jgi:hypothetical protein
MSATIPQSRSPERSTPLPNCPSDPPVGEAIGWSWPWLARMSAVVFLLATEVIHTAVIGEHFSGWGGLGWFFFGLSLVEGALAVALLARAAQRTYVATAVVSLLTIALWAWSRAIGLPSQPREEVGRADLVCSVFEFATAAVLAPLAWASARSWVARHRHVLAVGALALMVAGFTWLALPASDAEHGSHDPGTGATPSRGTPSDAGEPVEPNYN